MATANKTNVETSDRELIITRIFDAPRELVFETCSDCKHLNNWWGPRTWPLSYCKMDFREGGSWHYCMSGPNEGDESWGLVKYHEIVEPEKIVYTDYFSDKDGNVNENMPETLSAFVFSEQGGKTKVTIRGEYKTPEDLRKVLEMGMVDGMGETLDRLEEHLEVLVSG
ncbi:MAG: SRPBCC domain-containing protein [Balneolales bacterium]